MAEPLKYYAHGKLLLTGEYAVLDGALALAIPTTKGQWLEAEPNFTNSGFTWKSIDENGLTWFEASFSSGLMVEYTTDNDIAKRLLGILEYCVTRNPDFRNQLEGCAVTTILEFNREWGLGTSSTLIYLVSQWANVNPYRILDNSFGGSGYDIACAEAKGPILFQIENGSPQIKAVHFNPLWKESMHFIYLGKKQISRKEVTKFSDLEFNRNELVLHISEITNRVLNSGNLLEFTNALQEHEEVMSEILGYPTVYSQYFSTINCTIKSLGAWGGDFVLFIGENDALNEVRDLGYATIISWEEMLIR